MFSTMSNACALQNFNGSFYRHIIISVCIIKILVIELNPQDEMSSSELCTLLHSKFVTLVLSENFFLV